MKEKGIVPGGWVGVIGRGGCFETWHAASLQDGLSIKYCFGV